MNRRRRAQLHVLALLVSGVLLLQTSAPLRAQSADIDDTSRTGINGVWRVFSVDELPAGVLVGPHMAAFADDGTVFVLDTRGHRVVVFGPDGAPRIHFGGFGTGPGQLWLPQGLAVTGAGIVVLDGFGLRLQHYTPTGDFISEHSLPNWIRQPAWLVCDREGNAYVSDSVAKRVVKLSPTGGELAQFDIGDAYSIGFTLDEAGNLYVPDPNAQRIKIFDPIGRIQRTVETAGRVANVALTRDGSLWLRDQSNLVSHMNASGQVLESWSIPVSGERLPLTIYGPFVAPDDALYIADVTGRTVLRLSHDGQILAQLGHPDDRPERMDQPVGIAADASGRVFVGDVGLGRVLRFDDSGAPAATWDVPRIGANFARPIWPATLAVDAEGLVFSATGSRVQVRGPDGDVVRELLLAGTDAVGETAEGIAVDTTGDIYRPDARRGQVRRFTGDGMLVSVWGGRGSAPGEFNHPSGLAIDATGSIYVADAWNHRIQKVSPSGEVLAVFGPSAEHANPLFFPEGVAVDAEGNVWVADTGHDRVVVFAANGEDVTIFGGPGSGPGEFNRPRGIAVGPNGNVYVADGGNHRVQIFERVAVDQ